MDPLHATGPDEQGSRRSHGGERQAYRGAGGKHIGAVVRVREPSRPLDNGVEPGCQRAMDSVSRFLSGGWREALPAVGAEQIPLRKALKHWLRLRNADLFGT